MKPISTLFLSLAITATGFTASAQTSDIITVIDADFSIFTDGSESAPGPDLSGYSAYSSEFIKQTGWTAASKVYSAGGSVMIKDGGYITSAAMSEIPASNSNVKVTAQVRMSDSYGGAIKFSVGYSSASAATLIVEHDEWTTVSAVIPGVSSTGKLRVEPYLSAAGIFVRNVKVEYSPLFISAPVPYQPTNADGTQFTAMWKSVTGASSYELDVFSQDENANRDYFMQNQTTTTNSYDVTGLDPSKTYYFVVRAKNSEGGVSDDSEVIEVIKNLSILYIPATTGATEISDNGFTANWNAVENAESYIVTYFERIATTEAGTHVVFSEDFSGITTGNFDSLAYDGNLNDFTKEPGWETDSSKAYAKGNFVIYPISSSGYVITPGIDLTAENNFSVTINMCEATFGTYYTGGTVTLTALDKDDNELSSESIIIDAAKYNSYTFELFGKTHETRIKITYEGTKKLFIDDITVSQDLPSGYYIRHNIEVAQTTELSYRFDHTVTENAIRYYTVAAAARTVSGGYITEIRSMTSSPCEVGKGSGIESIESFGDITKAWRSAPGQITVAGSTVSIYDLSGHAIINNVTIDGSATFDIASKGIFIVIVDNKPFKIAL